MAAWRVEFREGDPVPVNVYCVPWRPVRQAVHFWPDGRILVYVVDVFEELELPSDAVRAAARMVHEELGSSVHLS